LEDVKAMKRIFTTTFLKPFLSPLLTHLTIRNKAEIVAEWKIKYQNLATLKEYAVLGQYCTLAMAKCLKRLNISYKTLQTAFEEHYNDRKAFNTHLYDKGITRKVWQGKIWDHFRR